MKTKNLASIAAFAFCGGVLRSFLGQYNFYGTLIANLLGCFLLAFLTYLFLELKPYPEWLTSGLTTGFLGAFTTFSSFNLDVLKLIAAQQQTTAIAYWVCSIGLGFALANLGAEFGTLIGKIRSDK